MCDSPVQGGELVRKDLVERSKIFNSYWKGDADVMLIGLTFLYIATALPSYPTLNLHCRLLNLTKKTRGGEGILPLKAEL